MLNTFLSLFSASHLVLAIKNSLSTISSQQSQSSSSPAHPVSKPVILSFLEGESYSFSFNPL
jgi:hypothetical protein